MALFRAGPAWGADRPCVGGKKARGRMRVGRVELQGWEQFFVLFFFFR